MFAEIVPGQRSGSAAPGSFDTDQSKQSIANSTRHKRSFLLAVLTRVKICLRLLGHLASGQRVFILS